MSYILNSKQVKKSVCPKCGAKKRFRLYFDPESLEIAGDSFGVCDRVESCGYHQKPDGEIIPLSMVASLTPTSYMDENYLHRSLGYTNSFIEYLYSHFGAEEVTAAIDKYYVGTSKKWNGSVVFWQVDIKGRIRGGKIMKYGSNGKRTNYVTWVHSVLGLLDFNMVQCLFGEHLVKDKPVKIVESEKTAIMCSIVFPHYTWIASASCGGLNSVKLNTLKGYDIELYPDNDAYDDWHKFKLPVNDFLHVNYPGEANWDMADYIMHKLTL